MMLRKYKWLAWIPALIWMGAIFYVSSLPNPMPIHERLLNVVVKKTGHLVGYAVLAVFYRFALVRERGLTDAEAIPWSWGFTLFYAATDEFHQSFVPGRHSSALDVIIDGTGALLGLWLCRKLCPSQ
jgi:VanZ family protein